MTSHDDDLRTRAERALQSRSPSALLTAGDENAETAYELEVHRVELEMQVDELRRAERNLEAARDRYVELFDRAPVPYLDLGAGYEILEANLAAATLLGQGRAALIGQTLPRYFSQRDSDRFQRFVKDSLDGGSGGSCEVAARTTGGVQVPVRLFAAGNGDGVTLHLAMVDLRELRRAEAQLADLVERAPVAMLLVDAEHRIVMFNEEAQGLFGYEKHELIGRKIEDLVPVALREAHVAHRTELARLEGTRRMNQGSEVLGLHKDGSEVPIEVALTAVETADGIGMLAVVFDLRERRQLEEEIRQAQKMEALGTLAGGIAHDFNNLLMGHSGCGTIALSLLPSESPARMYISEIVKSASTGAAITRRLLDFAHPDKSGWVIFDLHEALRASQMFIERLLSEDIAVTWQLDAVSPRIRFRTGEFDQLLLNLASNARDAMPSGGTLRISTRDQFLDSRNVFMLPEGHYVCLEVRDSGSGMSPEVQRRVFDPLFTTKPPGRGTGLGLSTVYSMVRQAGGRISVDSQVGVGATFSVILPNFSGPLALEEAPAKTPREPLQLTVLLVEDDAAVRLVTRFYLEQLGHQVLGATTADEAVECAKTYRNNIDVVLTDVVLTDFGGSEVARHVRELRPEIAVIFMSARSEQSLVADGRLEPGQKVLQKPFERDQLEAALRESIT